jgi:hypothetical protein
MYDECYGIGVVSLLQQQSNMPNLKVSMEFRSGVVLTPLSAVRLCERGVPPKGP